ncbi:hypothetical protein HPP92_005347 [Vanilla planifolia]|uniref:Uncharacterized protein n=1 Tax=Vanilla planifolia TaxID=51239 RepID=A0A835RPI6_VANPL|nr:hypothetical protein HPP92_005347 [Vanilla planifolia]
MPKLKNITGRNSIHLEVDDYSLDPATTLAGTLCLWLLSVIASCSTSSRYTFMEAGGVEALSHKLESYAISSQADDALFAQMTFTNFVLVNIATCLIRWPNTINMEADVSQEMVDPIREDN